MAAAFPAGLLDRLRVVEEVEIETRAVTGGARHRTVIWVVVDASGRVLVRTYRGPSSRWYREVSQQPECALHLDGLAIPVTARPALDVERVAACSGGYLEKYAGHRATPQMLAAENLPTTLELVPR